MTTALVRWNERPQAYRRLGSGWEPWWDAWGRAFGRAFEKTWAEFLEAERERLT